MFEALYFGEAVGGRGGGVEFFVETLSSDQKKENINFVSMGIDLGGIEVGKNALFLDLLEAFLC